MDLSIAKILELYDQQIAEMNRKIILLTVENEELKKQLESYTQKDE